MIEVRNVSKKYRKVKALDDISFNIEEGKITCILGINGVGKSTILKSIAGLIRPDRGEILIDNEKITYKIYDKISFVPDIDNHFAQYTIKSYQSSITTDENIISQIRHDLINESMEVFIENMKAINVKKEELIEIIKDKY